MSLDIAWLVTYGYLCKSIRWDIETTCIDSTYFCQTWKIDQRQVQNIWAIYSQRYQQLANALVLSSNSERLLFNLLANLIEICKMLVYMQELSPFCIWRGVRGGFCRNGSVDELEYKRSLSDDSLSSRKKVASDDSVTRLVLYNLPRI